MAQGRCAACTLVGPVTKLNIHVMTCPEYLDLFRREPERCLAPGEEFIRWRRDEDNPEVRADRREQRIHQHFQVMETRQEEQRERWKKKPSILD